jgi:hypothetical protein
MQVFVEKVTRTLVDFRIDMLWNLKELRGKVVALHAVKA